MAYDLLIKNGRIIDGSGMPAFRGDVAVRAGKIVELGKLSGAATRVIDADGLVVAPGFVDNHCHYDAQVTWDPLCSFSCYHGATTVVIGNCSLALAPLHPGRQERVAEFLSYVEAIPMEVLRTIDFSWETMPQYMDRLDHRVGVNVGTFIGHSAVRHYVMGDECQGRAATPEEIEAMRGIVRDAMQAGALGLSVSRNRGHFDPQGTLIPALWAEEEEIFALGNVLRDLGTGLIQSGGGRDAEHWTPRGPAQAGLRGEANRLRRPRRHQHPRRLQRAAAAVHSFRRGDRRDERQQPDRLPRASPEHAAGPSPWRGGPSPGPAHHRHQPGRMGRGDDHPPRRVRRNPGSAHTLRADRDSRSAGHARASGRGGGGLQAIPA